VSAETSEERFGEAFGGERMWGLQELPLPDAVSLVPQTWGWLAAAALLVLLAALCVWLVRMRRQRRAPARAILAGLDAISRGRGDAAEIPTLLRRAALLGHPRQEVAPLRGEAWIRWLNQVAHRELFAADDAGHLDALAYQGAAGADADRDRRLAEACRAWVERRRA
jgi:hypothetical protein